jgi:hypothetical protein
MSIIKTDRGVAVCAEVGVKCNRRSHGDGRWNVLRPEHCPYQTLTPLKVACRSAGPTLTCIQREPPHWPGRMAMQHVLPWSTANWSHLGFPQRFCSEFSSTGIWRSVARLAFAVVSNERNAFIFKGWKTHELTTASIPTKSWDYTVILEVLLLCHMAPRISRFHFNL